MTKLLKRGLRHAGDRVFRESCQLGHGHNTLVLGELARLFAGQSWNQRQVVVGAALLVASGPPDADGAVLHRVRIGDCFASHRVLKSHLGCAEIRGELR